MGRSRAILQLRLLRLSRLLRHRSGEYGKLAMASRDNYEGYISRKESSVVKLANVDEFFESFRVLEMKY